MNKILLLPIRFYQRFLSPMFPPHCRFYPTCSEYSYQAIERFGIIKGLIHSIIRLSKCHPFNKGGFDPIKK